MRGGAGYGRVSIIVVLISSVGFGSRPLERDGSRRRNRIAAAPMRQTGSRPGPDGPFDFIPGTPLSRWTLYAIE
jgi:hypothetical protein